MKKLLLVIVVMLVFTTCVFGNTWIIDYQKDRFGDNMEGAVLSTMGDSGSFSNTVTTGSDLTYVIVIFEERKLMNLGLLEYSKYPVKNYKYEYVEMNIKSDNGDTHTIKIVFGTSSFIIDDDGYYTFLNLIKNNNKLKVYIKVENSRYNFEINCMGFTEQYNNLIK